MSDLAAIITAGVGALGTVGGGVTWLWARVEKRFDEVETKLAACEKRESDQREINAKHLIVIELLWQDVKRRSRGASDVLERCGKLLDDLKKDEGK